MQKYSKKGVSMLPKFDIDYENIFKYDVAISFAGKNRNIAEKLANRLQKYHLEVFYDENEQADLIGKNLYQYLKEIYSEKCLYCIVLVSEHYLQRKWPSKVELPATQERDFVSDEEYILPLLLDDTKIPGIERTTGHIDLREMSIEEASELIAHKVLKKHYSESVLKKKLKEISRQKITEIEGLSDADFVSLFSERIFNCSHGEIRFVAITAIQMIEDLQFMAALEMFLNKTIKENRTVTLRFYILDPESEAARRFVKLSDEPLNILKQKIYKSQEALKALINDKKKNRIRARIYFYSGLPCINLFQVDNEFFFRVYYIGKKQGKFSVFYVSEEGQINQFAIMLRNMISDLEFRSRTEDINWF